MVRDKGNSSLFGECGEPADEGGKLWQATSEIQTAGDAAGVRQVLVEEACRLSGASSAVWWEHDGSDDRLVARATSGVKLAGRARTIRTPGEFWCAGEQVGSPIVLLSPRQKNHAAFLKRVHSRSALIIRAHDGERWRGALSVHREGFEHGIADLLVALTQQAAAALRVRELHEQRRDAAESHRQCISELAEAFGSAVNLDGLLAAVCQLATRTCQADTCLLFLAGDEEPLRLRAQADSRPIAKVVDPEVTSAAAERARRSRTGEVLWQEEGEGGQPGAALQRAGFQSVLGAVLPIRGKPLGCLILLSEQRNAFSSADRDLMLSFAAQAAVAIENLQLFEDMQQRLLEMADLTWVSTHVAATLEIDRISAVVAEGAAKALDMPTAALFLADRQGELRPIGAGCYGTPHQSEGPLPAGGHLGSEVLASGGPLGVSDVEHDKRTDDPLVKWLGVRSVLCAPMIAQQGLRGLLVVGDQQPRSSSTHMAALLSAYANQAALALQSALLHQDMVQHSSELSKLFELSQKLASSPGLSVTLQTVLSYATELLQAPAGAVMLLDPETKEFVVKATHGFPAEAALHYPLKLSRGEGLAGKAVQSGTVLASADLSRDGRSRLRDAARLGGLRSGVSAPLISQGRSVGVLNLYRLTSQEFTENEKQLLMAIANSAAVAIENAHLYREAQERSQFVTALMGEISHRMRNSLQTVAALLRMELKRPQRRSTEDALKRGIARVQTMAVVHELMRAREFQFVDMKRAARRIVDLTCQTVAGRQKVETQVSGARVMLPSQKATSAALILSELTDNALRHGLQKAKDRKIDVSLAESGGEVVIQVKDSGVGLPPEFGREDAPGLGLSIVKGVVEQDLGGKMEFETGGGLTVRVRFPKQ